MINTKNISHKVEKEIYKGLFDNSPNGISVVDLNTNQHIGVNDAKLKMLGYTEQEYLNLDPSDTLAEIQFDGKTKEEFAKETVSAIIEYGHFEGRIVLKTKKGQFVQAEVSSFLHQTQDGKFIYSIIKDVSETVIQNERLSEKNNLLNSILEKSEIGIILYNDQERKISRLNKKFTEITGFNSNDIENIDKHLNTFPSTQPNGENTEERFKKLRKELNENGKVTHKTWHLKKDGGQFLGKFTTIKLPGNQSHLKLTMFEDITSEYLKELEIEESEERFRRFAENSPNVIFKLGINNEQKLEYVNPVVERIFGYKPEELLDGEIDTSKFVVDQSSRLKLRQELKKGAKFVNIVCQIKKSNGKAIWTDIKVVPVVSTNGELIAIEGVITNIDKIKKSQQYLLEKSAELETKNKELEQFTYIASHDLRAPVVNMTTLLEMLEKDVLSDYNSQIIGRVETTASKMYTTLHDLIDVIAIQKRTTSPFENLDINELCNDIRSQLSEDIFNSKAIIDSNYQIQKFKYVRVHLKSILQNLITNSIKYCSDDRRLHIKIATEKYKEFVLLTYTDNGRGIDMKKFGNRIFGMFQVFHKDKNGKGLGLYIIKRQIESLGGKIEVESQLDVGTTFKIYLKAK